jgi:hypothetical protein
MATKKSFKTAKKSVEKKQLQLGSPLKKKGTKQKSILTKKDNNTFLKLKSESKTIGKKRNAPQIDDLFEKTKIRQKLFGGIVYFEDKSHYFVSSLKEDEYFDSRDNVRDELEFGKIKIGKYDDWYLPNVFELELMEKYINTKDIGDFEPDFYWSNDTYEDTEDECGDAVEFTFTDSNNIPSYDDYLYDLKYITKIQKDGSPSYQGGGEYSGGRPFYIRLVRKVVKK